MTDKKKYAAMLAALGHEARLEIYRLLVRVGEEGLNIGEIGSHLGLPASTLSHHLSCLVDAGLVKQERQGRQVSNKVDFDVMNQAVAFLTDECCKGLASPDRSAA